MRTKTGIVTSAKMQKTVVVTVHTYEKHPVYGKPYRKSKKFSAHTEEVIPEGAEVVILEVAPISKNKCWKVVEVLGSHVA